MALTISARLVDTNNKPLINQTVDVCFYNTSGRAQRIATARTSRTGTFKASNNTNLGTFLPRVLLRTQQGGKWLNLTNTPKSYSKTRLDFGTVKVSTQPTMTVASTTFHTIPASLSIGGSTSSSAQLRTLTSKNTSLEKQLADSKKKTQELTLKLDEFKRIPRPSTQSDPAEKEQLTQLKRTNLDLTNLIKAKDIRIRELETNTGKKPSLQVEEFSKDAVISSALEAVNKADTQNKGRFQLKSARMDLKVLSGSTKDKVRLIKDTESLQYINPDLVSTLTLDLDGSNDAAETQAAPEPIKMPDLTGYTRSLADRRLDEISISAQWYNQQLAPSEKAAAGTIISQTPKAGRSIGEDTEVILIIGVAQEEEA